MPDDADMEDLLRKLEEAELDIDEEKTALETKKPSKTQFKRVYKGGKYVMVRVSPVDAGKTKKPKGRS